MNGLRKTFYAGAFALAAHGVSSPAIAQDSQENSQQCETALRSRLSQLIDEAKLLEPIKPALKGAEDVERDTLEGLMNSDHLLDPTTNDENQAFFSTSFWKPLFDLPQNCEDYAQQRILNLRAKPSVPGNDI